jgi:hypothetical protein
MILLSIGLSSGLQTFLFDDVELLRAVVLCLSFWSKQNKHASDDRQQTSVIPKSVHSRGTESLHLCSLYNHMEHWAGHTLACVQYYFWLMPFLSFPISTS